MNKSSLPLDKSNDSLTFLNLSSFIVIYVYKYLNHFFLWNMHHWGYFLDSWYFAFLINFMANDTTLSKLLKVLKRLTLTNFSNINSGFFSLFLTSLIIINVFFSLTSVSTISTESLHSGALSDHASIWPLRYFEPWNHSYFYCSFLCVHPLEAVPAILLFVFIWYHLLISVSHLVSFTQFSTNYS